MALHDANVRSTERLVAMAQRLSRRGVHRVDELIVDASYFDKQVLPPAFEQQPDEVSPFSRS